MFFFPYGTDAPIYYWPIITVLIIVVNVFVFIWGLGHPDQVEPFILAFGEGLQPIQWITSNFLHAGFGHLFGNMVFLWSFGLVIEGKLGCWKMLVVYLGIGVIESFVVQFFMQGQGHTGGALGASGCIFGLMAMSLIWAPENKIQCLFIIFLIRHYAFEMTITVLVGLMLIYQFVIQSFIGFSISSAALHLIGAGIGFAVAIAMLKWKMVDCENWDAFTVWAGKNVNVKKLSKQDEADIEALRQQREQQQEQLQGPQQSQKDRHKASLREIHEIICNGKAMFALKAHLRMSQEYADWQLPEDDLFNLIMSLHKEKVWSESVPLMIDYLKRNKEDNTLMRLKLAQILVVSEKKPAQALKVMAQVDELALDADQRAFLIKLRARADELLEQSPYEIAGEDI